ncbi:MAG: hypothetical protein ACFCUQ_05750 [Kiloniellales bacterium]
MDARLSLVSHQLDAADLQELTHELCILLNQETEIAAAFPEGPLEPGARGDGITLATLVLTFLSSGTAVALLQVAKAYFERDRTLVLKLKRADGQEFVIEQSNIRTGEVDNTLRLAREFLGD